MPRHTSKKKRYSRHSLSNLFLASMWYKYLRKIDNNDSFYTVYLKWESKQRLFDNQESFNFKNSNMNTFLCFLWHWITKTYLFSWHWITKAYLISEKVRQRLVDIENSLYDVNLLFTADHLTDVSHRYVQTTQRNLLSRRW